MDSKESKMHLDTLEKIKSIVERYLYPTEYDVEDIAVKIFIELYEKKQYLSNLLVRNRCIDEIRHKTQVKFSSIEENPGLVNKVELKQDNPINPDIIENLVSLSGLNSSERRAIYNKFYLDGEVAKEVLDPILLKLRKTLELIELALERE